jgi:bacteriocin biosynthesis cyclodehydratase domain-containing protein
VRPLLKPGLRRLWRDASTLQIGTDPDRAVVLGGLDPRIAWVVDLLDGTRDEAAITATARRRGLDPDQVRRLVGLLVACGTLDDAATDPAPLAGLSAVERDRLAPDLAALSMRRRGADGGLGALALRRAALVEVRGAGRVGATLAVLLAAAGVGAVRVLDPAPTRPGDVSAGGLLAQDVGRARQDAAADAIRRVAPAATARGGRPTTLVVLAPVGTLTSRHADGLRGRVHLAASVREGRGVIGPLVLPGASSCLHCHDLHRRDRDPLWPRIAAQLATDPAGVAPCEAPLAMAVAALGAAQALAHLDGEPTPATLDGTLEVALPDLRVRRRSWQPHPECSCAIGRLGGPARQAGVTMHE